MTQVQKKPAKSIDVALRELLLSGKASTQEAICEALEAEGFVVNQSKISRLLTRIGAIKVNHPEGGNRYRLPHEVGLAHEYLLTPQKLPFKQMVLSMEANEVMIVIHTTPGAAGMVAREIDLQKVDLEVLGTIAGDDTIFVVPMRVKEMQAVFDHIKGVLLG